MILQALSALYDSAVRTRLFLYRNGVFKTLKLRWPVISVGNLTTGGTGKTPLVRLFAELLLEAGLRPSILTRGYRGGAESKGTLVSDGKQILCTPAEAGDEPFLLAQQVPGALVAVGKNRWASGNRIERGFGKVVHLLDDGFQHLRLHRDLDLLLVDATQRLESAKVLPAGIFREPLEAVQRADAVLLTRSHLVEAEELNRVEETVRRLNPSIPVFHFHHEMSDLVEITSGCKIQLSKVRDQPVAALAAIGNPGQFLADLQQAGFDVKEQFLYRDHHRFSQKDLEQILALCKRKQVTILITTEKDAVRLRQLPSPLPENRLYVLPIIACASNQEAFRRWFLERVSAILRGLTHGAALATENDSRI